MGQRTDTTCSRDGALLVVPAGCDPPNRCVKCNAAADVSILQAFEGPASRTTFGLCFAHHRARQRQLKAGVYTLLLAFLLSVLAMLGVLSLPWPAIAAVAASGPVLIALGIRSHLKLVALRDGHMRLSGCGTAFLDSLDGP